MGGQQQVGLVKIIFKIDMFKIHNIIKKTVSLESFIKAYLLNPLAGTAVQRDCGFFSRYGNPVDAGPVQLSRNTQRVGSIEKAA
jgi:hypothetical protein